MNKSLEARARQWLASFGFDPSEIEQRELPLFEDAERLVVAEVSRSGREHLLTEEAACAWANLKANAAYDGVNLIIISAFRSFERQAELIKSKIDRGLKAKTIFTSSAPPGYSEHHTGKAVDVGTPGCEPLSLDFQGTSAFSWLQMNARRFGFHLSYPESNELGFSYEPWHWCLVANRPPT